ncbi:MAG: DUF507 family protein [Nitrospiraceae bacterium]
MRLSKERVHHIAATVCQTLQQEGLVEILSAGTEAVDGLEQAIQQELSVEDRLNNEVREMLKAYTEQIERGQVDYQKMFTMIKTKLVRDRGIVL